jgi:hypothetical protein
MKPWQTPLNKPSSNMGETKEQREREDPSLNQKSRTQSGSLRIVGTNHVLKPPPITRSISERDGKPQRVISLEEPSPAMVCG